MDKLKITYTVNPEDLYQEIARLLYSVYHSMDKSQSDLNYVCDNLSEKKLVDADFKRLEDYIVNGVKAVERLDEMVTILKGFENFKKKQQEEDKQVKQEQSDLKEQLSDS